MNRPTWVSPHDRALLLRHYDGGADGAACASPNAIARCAGVPRRTVIRTLGRRRASVLGLVVLGGGAS
jgi:hypothetical protein